MWHSQGRAVRNPVCVSGNPLFDIEHQKAGTRDDRRAYNYLAFNCLARLCCLGIELPL
jgi:hypothetical protein